MQELTTTGGPIRITIDFRDSVLPSRGWVLGRIDGSSDRIDLLALASESPTAAPAPEPIATAADGECTCADGFCDRDHDLD